MNNIDKLDSNFKVETKLDLPEVQFFNAEHEPFKIYGVFKEDGQFRRMPQSIADKVSDGVASLNKNTAGGRLRFKTDSNYLAINAKMPSAGKMPHFAFTGSIGFDIYIKENGRQKYFKTFVPPLDITNGYESVHYFGDKKLREITINFPLYSQVSDIYIGVCSGAVIEESEEYSYQKPLVYYGSSITQGGCVSRPGNCYQNIISRRFDIDYINLGFSGNAKAEEEMAEYISNLDMTAFIYDYDHNAPSVEHLRNTHERMFVQLRKNNPELPIILMSRPKYTLNKEETERLRIITDTYENALKNGDKNVYLLDGKALMAIAGDDGTVDDCHPNDLGFFSMAKALGDLLEKII